MKKLLYAAIVAFLFVGGLAAGVVHKQSQRSGGDSDTSAIPTETVGGLSLADLGASTPTEGLPSDGTTSETLTLDLSGDATESPTATPEAAMEPDSGRTFGGGSNPDPVSSGGSSGSSSSASSSPSSWSDPPPKTSSARAETIDYGSDEIPSNIDYGNAGTIIEDPPPPIEPVATPRKARSSPKSVAVAEPATEPDPFDELPTVEDPGASSFGSDPFADTGSAATSGDDPFASSGATDAGSDPFASTGSAATAETTPDPFAVAPVATPAPMVAMSMPAGGGDLLFGQASKRPALVKVGQKQNGASSVISIELAGSARYKIIQVPRRRQVWIDFEGTEVPGGSTSVGGSAAHVREISAKFFANENGGTSIARVILQLDDGVVQMNERGKEELAVTPNRGTGEASQLQLTIGAKSRQF